jgi:hypothetical protein
MVKADVMIFVTEIIWIHYKQAHDKQNYLLKSKENVYLY